MAVQIARGYRNRLLDDVRTAARSPGNPRDQYFSAELWDRWAAAHNRPLAGKMRYWFGSWTNVTDEAGLPGPEHYPRPGERQRMSRPSALSHGAAPAPASLADTVFAEQG